MLIVKDVNTLDRRLSAQPEKITIDENAVEEMYYNPDANSGCQIVINTWDTSRVRKVAEKDADLNNTEYLQNLLSDIESEATQYCYDVVFNEDGSIENVDVVEDFLGSPVMSEQTYLRLEEEFALEAPIIGLKDHSYNVGVINNATGKSVETQGDFDIDWLGFKEWLFQDMYEMQIGPYSELTIEYVEDAGPADKDNEDESNNKSSLGIDCVLIDKVNEKIRTFDPYAYMDAGSDEENYQQITDDIYENCAKETLRTLGEIRDFEKENDESYDDTEKLIDEVATEALVYAASFVDNSIAADVLAQSLMDDNVSTYDMFDDLQYMYLAANKEGKEYIDRTLTILLGNKMSELAGQILDEAKQAEAV